MYPFEGEEHWPLISHTGIIIMILIQQVCSRFADIYILLCFFKIINKNLKHSMFFSQLSPFVLVSIILIVYFGTLLSICFKNLLIFCFFYFCFFLFLFASFIFNKIDSWYVYFLLSYK